MLPSTAVGAAVKLAASVGAGVGSCWACVASNRPRPVRRIRVAMAMQHKLVEEERVGERPSLVFFPCNLAGKSGESGSRMEQKLRRRALIGQGCTVQKFVVFRISAHHASHMRAAPFLRLQLLYVDSSLPSFARYDPQSSANEFQQQKSQGHRRW